MDTHVQVDTLHQHAHEMTPKKKKATNNNPSTKIHTLVMIQLPKYTYISCVKYNKYTEKKINEYKGRIHVLYQVTTCLNGLLRTQHKQTNKDIKKPYYLYLNHNKQDF